MQFLLPNFPVVRFGRVAMLPDERIPWSNDAAKPPALERLYLVETQSYGGNSGSPVFFFLGADRVSGSLTLGPPVIVLAGIMKGRFNDVSPPIIGFVQVPTASVPVFGQNIGIACAILTYLLLEILFSDPLSALASGLPDRKSAKKINAGRK